jgi:hypothetical protein
MNKSFPFYSPEECEKEIRKFAHKFNKEEERCDRCGMSLKIQVLQYYDDWIQYYIKLPDQLPGYNITVSNLKRDYFICPKFKILL